MKLQLTLFILFSLSLIVTGCNSGTDSPTDPVESFFAAFEEMDAANAAEVVCSEYRDDVKTGLDMIFGFMSLGGESEIDIVDLELEITQQSEDEASVMATGGQIRISVMGEVQEQEIAETAEVVRVIREDGKWLLCDVAFAEGFGP